MNIHPLGCSLPLGMIVLFICWISVVAVSQALQYAHQAQNLSCQAHQTVLKQATFSQLFLSVHQVQ